MQRKCNEIFDKNDTQIFTAANDARELEAKPLMLGQNLDSADVIEALRNKHRLC